MQNASNQATLSDAKGLPTRFVYHSRVSDFPSRAAELADIMQEFGLSEASIEGDGWKVAFRKNGARAAISESTNTPYEDDSSNELEPIAVEAAPQGTPISSPMTGIYYSASSPSSPPFVQEGDTVDAGQVVALIEAMKVFNEITSPVTGRVLRMTAQNGDLVNPGDPLIFVG